MKKPLIALFSLLFTFALVSTVQAATTPLASVKSGDLIRGQSFTAVYYYGADGFRYVFPSDKVYFTWYKDFSTVKWVSDDDLTKIQIGGNVTYRPGVKMLKINSDPTVYAVSKNSTLRPIGSEMVAIDIYGKLWNKMIDDVPDAFFGNYQIGSKIEFPSQYSIASEKVEVTTVNEDKSLSAPTIVQITDAGYDTPTIHVTSGKAVKFINSGSLPHSVTEWDSIWGSGTLQPGETYSRYFIKKGTWMYYSTYDAKTKMTGAIIVE
jgi:plastocyanin